MVIFKKEKKLAINPLKVSQPLGGVLALQGLFRTMPIVHGSQGCAAFIKALMTQHFREPISLQTTALQEMNIIFGAEQSMVEALDIVIEKHTPSIIAVLSTALTETAGDDLNGNIKNYKKDRCQDDCFIFPVTLPDFEGSLESGYRLTVEALVKELIHSSKAQLPMKKVKNQVNLLPSAHLTPGDVMELKRIISSFGLEVITAPDLSTSLGGALAKGFSPITRGGATFDQLQRLLSSEMTIAVGASMEGAAKALGQFAEIPYKMFNSLSGLKANDEFFSFLQHLSGKPVPQTYRWERDNLLDCMLDAHFYFSGKKIVAALEPDHLYSIIELCKEMGGKMAGLVTTFSTPLLSEIEEEIIIGDLDDLEKMAADADLWISNSHGEQGSSRMKIPFLPMGFPIFHQIGSSLATSIGYRGTTELIIKMSNLLIEESGKIHDESRICYR
ncbi:nitrogenase iron-molybdenum cofactor biosynthesis protein NifN [Bacillus sp. 03113]|uniref:nitrogenase iron-molybdenum cofactor biosynthesis protein NifN n=1 Tax=Bacillus sp. 03113 TaxID=2578211 RepID=UPI0011436397|nr:nitrogenase iron-molybdenum cofactor biosynthesis protein NifN [Bacillus sp. 03113]